MEKKGVPQSVQIFIDKIVQLCGEKHKKWAINFAASFSNTLVETIRQHEDGTTFVVTGDIPAMWLRDSAAQVRPYLVLAREDNQLLNLICGVVKKQFFYINIDPYANAFNEKPNRAGHQTDITKMNDWIWERKYEVDSLCYPIQLAYLLYKNTGCVEQFNNDFVEGVKKIITVFTTEQDHRQSDYSFVRETWRSEDTLINNGLGAHVARTGMTWSGFRPSDDACQYGYLIPANMFAVVVLGYIKEIFTNILDDKKIVDSAEKLRNDISSGIEKFGRTKNQHGDTIYAYEVDGKGNATIMDDSNVPSLISAPYLGYCTAHDDIYLATRKTVLSEENPYFYEGQYGKGIGSSHTPKDYIWPIAIAMEGLTTSSKSEKEKILNMLVATDGGTHLMHESFDVENPNKFTREWFSWANMMFCELVMDYFDIKIRC